MEFSQSLEEWARDKPLSILQLDPADRAVLRVADERDAIQKKTFTKWVNKHLTKTYTCLHVCKKSCICESVTSGKRVGDLFEDVRDGHNLISLLEILAGEHLPRERGKMRFHMIQNVQTVLDFLRYRKIKLVNIRAEDIVDGNPKLILGLIWTIILHFQISDIVVGMEENVSAKDVLLKWAQKSTAKYPGVRVGDFTKSWRDGLAFNALIHRNRPDLIDWGRIQRRNPRERLENAFSVAESQCGVTRLLDPEDVDTPQPDEKSLITYISSLYDVFPEPPRLHPLHDTDSQKKSEEYRETATTLYAWIREHISIMQDRHFSPSLIEMRKLATEMNRFRVEEVPPRAHAKQRLNHLFQDAEKQFRDGDIDRDLHIDNIERSWQVLMMSHQEKDQAIHDEIKKLEKLQRIAEKLHREAKQVETRLDDIEQRIEEEARRIDRLHPLDAKNNCDHLERDLQLTEETIKSMFNDAQMLREARFQQAPELHRMVQQLHQRWINIRTLLHNRLLSVLATISFPIEEKSVTRMSKTVLETRLVDTDPNFRQVQEVSEWIRNKQKQLNDADYGSDLPSVQAELEKQLREHRTIEKFQTNVDKCASGKSSFRGEELQLYINYLNTMQKSYADLLLSSKKRHSDLETLMDFVQSATNELIWLSEKEEREITRDWSSKNLSLPEVEQYYEGLMSELEKREIQFNAVQDRGESLVLQHHPASKCIETYMSAMQTQWSWLLQLTLCLETHMKYVSTYQHYFSDVRECEQSIVRKEEMLNSVFSKSDFTLDEGEGLLREMQDVREELTKFGDFIQGITNQSREIIPLKQRKTNVVKPIHVTAICSWHLRQQMEINKDERCVLHDNSQRVRWRVTNSSGLEGMVPGVCFLIPPPDKEALDAAERLRKQYDRVVTLWQKKQLKMRQNMIFATIRVVKSWDLAQFLAMGAEQRNAIRRALNEDAEKLIQEGEANDPALRRLRKEIDDVNKLFDEFDKKALEAEKSKNTSKMFLEQISILHTELEEVERTLVNKVNATIPRDLDVLERTVIEHKEFETRLHSYESRVTTAQRTFASIPQKTSALQSKLDKVVEKWERIWNLSNLYVERLKCVEIVLVNLEETTTMVSQIEVKVASYDNMPSDDDGLRRVSNDLYNLQNTAQASQHIVETLVEDTKNIRRMVEKSRTSQKRHPDVEKLEDDVHRATTRYSNACSQIVDRLRVLEQTTDLAQRYNSSYQQEMNWVDSVDSKSKSLSMMEGRANSKIHPHMTLYNSVIEEKITIEQVNTMGARLAKEAKDYDSILKQYREKMEDIHPSLDASLVKKAKIQPASEVVTQELDVLNLKYQLISDQVYHRLQELAKTAKEEDPNSQISISEVPVSSPLKTYRSVTDETSPLSESSPDEVDFIQKESILPLKSSAPVPPARKRSTTPIRNGSKTNGTKVDPDVALRNSFNQSSLGSEGLNPESTLHTPVVVDPTKGEKLTLAQAIGSGLIDVKTGQFVDPETQERKSLQEATKSGHLDPKMMQKLEGVSGLTDPETGKELTMMEAIRKGWFDLTKGRFVNPSTGEAITPAEAAQLGKETQQKVSPPPQDSASVNPPQLLDFLQSECIDLKTGDTFVNEHDKNGQIATARVPLKDAFSRGYLQLPPPSTKSGSSLSDLIDQNLVTQDSATGQLQVVDRFGGKLVSIQDSIQQGLLNPDFTEVFDMETGRRVSASSALDRNLLNPSRGVWVGKVNQQSVEVVPVDKAREQLLIMKPLNLKDFSDLELLVHEPNSNALLIDPLTHKQHTVLEAIALGIVDIDTKTVRDTKNEELISLQAALVKDVVSPQGDVIDTKTNEVYSIPEAVSKGLLSSVKRTSIFTIPCILDSSKDEQDYISLTDAVNRGLLNPKSMTVKDENNRNFIDKAFATNMISPQVFPTLNSPSGFYEGKQELNVLGAVVNKKILPSGEVWDDKTNAYAPMDLVVSNGSLDPEKARFLKGLYNINLTTATVTKTIRHTVTVHSKEMTSEKQPTFGIQEAIDSRLIDEATGTFTNPLTGQRMSIEDAISSGQLGLTQQWPTPESPTEIQEINETMAELNRELLHLPENGWTLREAIDNKYFNPREGLLTIPGTDRQVTFEECLQLKLIDPSSAKVLDQRGKEISPERSLEKQILDATGHYHDDAKFKQPLTMEAAIAQNLIRLSPVYAADATKTQAAMRQQTPPKQAESTLDTELLSVIQVSESITFNPNTLIVNDSDRDEQFDLLTAVLKGKIEPRKVKVKDPSSGKEMNINEALRRGIVDKKSGQVRLKPKPPVSLKDAVRSGIVTVLPMQVSEIKPEPTPSEATRKVSTTEGPVAPSSGQEKDKEKSPSRSSVTHLQLTSVEDGTVLSEEVIECESVFTTTTTLTTTTVLITKVSRMRISPEELTGSNLVDAKTISVLSNPENFRGSRGEPLTLEQSIDLGKIDGESGRILDPSQQEVVNINEAILRNLLDNQGNVLLPAGRNLSAPELTTQGLYDPQLNKITHPETGDSMTVSEAIASDVLNPLSPVTDPVSKKRVSIVEALEQNVVCNETGNVISPEEPVPFLEAVKSGIYEQYTHPLQDTIPPVAMTIPVAHKKGLINLKKGTLTNPTSGSVVPIAEAVSSGLLKNYSSPAADGAIKLEDAVARGAFDDKSGMFTHPTTGAKMPLEKALYSGLVILPSPKKKFSMTAEGPAVIPTGTMVVSKSQSPTTKSNEAIVPGTQLTLAEAVRSNVIDPNTVVTDSKSGQQMPLSEAVKRADFNPEQVSIPDPNKHNSKISLKEGLKMGLLAVAAAPVAVIGAPVIAGIAAAQKLKSMTGKEALSDPVQRQRGVGDQKSTSVYKQNQELTAPAQSPEESVEDLLADYTKPYPLHIAIGKGQYQPETGLLKLEGTNEFVTIQDAIARNEVDPAALTYRDPRTSTIISLDEAINSGLVNPKTGQAVDPLTGGELPLHEAVDSGLLLTPRRKLSLTDLICSDNYDPDSNTVKIETTNESMPLKQAVESNAIDLDTILVQDFKTNSVLPLRVAASKELVDLDAGTVKTSSTGKCSLPEALERGILIEVKQPVPLSQMILKGLYEPETGKFLNPKTGEHVPLSEALADNIVDSNSVHVKDTREGFAKKMSLDVALQEGFISDDGCTVQDFANNTTLSLPQALEQGLIVDSKTPLSLQKALHLGLYSEADGRVTDPNTGKTVTLNEAIRRLIINPSLPCYWDDKEGVVLSLVETCRAGIIDRQEGIFKVQDTGAKLSLGNALDQEYILDIEKPFSLYRAVQIGLYNKMTGKFVHPSSGKHLTLQDACKEDLIDIQTSIIKHYSTWQVMKLPEAVAHGLVNPIEGTYLHTKSLPLDEARRRGFILTTERPLSLVKVVKEHLFNPQTGKIVDALVGDWLNVQRAVQVQIVDPAITAIQNLGNGQIKSLNAAIEDQSVNSEKGLVVDARNRKFHTLDVGVESQLIITVPKPVTFSDALSQNAIDLRRGTFFDPRSGLTSSLGDAILNELVEPTSAVVRDPTMEQYFNLKEAMKSGLIDLTKRALVDPLTGKLKPLCIIFEQGTVVFFREPITFDSAVEKGYLNLLNGQFCDTSLIETPITLKEAIDIHAIDPNSALLKDTLNKRLLSLPEAYARGLIDPDKATVFNTATNHLVPLDKAVATGLIVTPKTPLSLLSALEYSLYNPETGKFSDPYKCDSELTLNQAIQQGLIDPSTTVVKDPATGRIIPLLSAINEGIIDGDKSVVNDPTTNSQINLIDAWRNGLLVPAEARLAIEEKYRSCTASIDNLLDWLTAIEKQLASQETVKETIEEVKRQLITVKSIRDDLESHSHTVTTCLDQIRQLVATAGEVLSSEELTILDKNGKQLKTRYDRAADQSEKLLRKLMTANDELRKYKTETTTFKSWMEKSIRILEEKERNIENLNMAGREKTKEFVSDVVAHQGDLRFITMSAQKFLDESREYVHILNEYRSSLPQRLPMLQERESSIRHEVIEITRTYQELLARVNRLFDKLALGSRQKEFQEALNRAVAWLKDVTPRAQRILSEPVATDPKQVEDQLSRAKTLQSEILKNGTLIDSVRQATNNLLNSLEELSPTERQTIESTAKDVESKYKNLVDTISEKVHDLDSASGLVKKIMENMKQLTSILDREEKRLPKSAIPQSRDEADKVMRVLRQIIDELNDQQGLLDNTRSQINDLLRKRPNVPDGERLRDAFIDIDKRWKTLQDTCRQRLNFLDNVKEFHDTHDNLSKWLNAKDKMMGVLGPIASDPRMVANQLQQVQVIRDEFRAQKPTLDSFNTSGDNILAQTNPNSPDGRKIDEKLANINQKWNDLLHKLDDREGSLEAASGASADFYNNLNKLQDNLHKISDDLDDLALDKGKLGPDELLKRLNDLDRALAAQRPMLAGVESAGEHLCDILSDPASKADIKQKLAQVGRLFNQCQKKLDNAKAELENSRKDAQEFDEACEAAQEWLHHMLTQLTDKLLVSADRDILKQQVNQFEPIYREVMSKEHEIIITINKGKDLAAAKSTRQNDKRTILQNIEVIQKGWDKLKKEAVDRHTRLQTCTEHCRKYDKLRDTFVKWLTQAEHRLEDLRLTSFKKPDVDKQLKEMNSFKNDLWRHAGEFDSSRNSGETFLGATDRDKDGVTKELHDMKVRWDALNNAALARIQELEDASARLGEFNDNVRDLKNVLNRCEDKLQATGDNKDPKILQKIKAIADEAAKLDRPLATVKNQGDNLCDTAHSHGCDSGHIRDAVDDLLGRYDNLRSKLDGRGSDLEAAQRALAEFMEALKGITLDISNLEDELNGMKPVGRDIPTVNNQIREMEQFAYKIKENRSRLDQASAEAENLIRRGIAVDPKGMKNQIDSLKKQLGRVETKAQQRESELDKTLKRLEAFYQLYHNTDDAINGLIQQEKSFSKGIGRDVESIRAQQAQFKEFRRNYVDVVGKQVDECNKNGQGLIQSASSGVNTTGLERDLEKLNDKWNALKERLIEQERKLDVALLNSGKFKEALEGLNKWLSDMEDMVKNQKPPSADFKVVKAQLQEQKFLNKMLADRRPSVTSLFQMGNEIAANADPAEKASIEREMKKLGERYDNLCDGASDRQKALEDAMRVAKEFQDKLGPLTEWLEKTGKKLKEMSLIPTDEDKIQRRIKEHEALHDTILGKQPYFNELADIAANLMELVGDEEAAMVADKLQEVTDKYGALVDESEALGNLLRQAKGALRHLVLSYEELIRWMDDMDKRLNKYTVVSVHKDKLLDQLDKLAGLTEEIKSREKQVDDTVDSGIELMKSITSDEAIQLKDKLDSLQRRFADVTQKAADLLRNGQEALPLVTQFHDNHNQLADWMTDAEGLLQTLESASLATQEKEIIRLEKEIVEQRKVLDVIQLIGPQLCQLSPGEGASYIESLVTRDNRRFDAICEQVQRRAERIHMSKQRSLEVLSDIDDLLEWFREIEGQIKDAEKPSCEPEVVKIQLQEHRALNDEINSQKARVRDVLATAKKVLREAPQGQDTATLREKADDLKETMEAVSKLSADRLNVLEQALPLAIHFFETHNDLNRWMDVLEDELVVLDTPALRPDQIMKLQDKVQAFIQSINEHKPLVDKLNKTGGALVKICNDDDAGKVEEIMHADNERYNALKVHLREKQQMLEKALQDSSQFKDKLDGMLNALENTADQVNNAEPVSAHPDKIREQIDENNAIIDDVKKREDAFNAVKRQANDLINKAPNKNDPAVKDIKQKLDRLNSLWDQIQKATKNRSKNLDEALILAEKFWAELQAIMEKLDALQETLESQEPPAVEPKAIQKQQNALQDIKRDIERVKPEVQNCKKTGESLMRVCGEPDKPEIKKNIQDLDNAWDNITALFAKREENLIDAMEKAMEFHDTLQGLLKFLDKAEPRLASFGVVGADIEAVKRQIKELKDFKSEVDPMMVKVEALNRQAHELTARSSPDQAIKIKGPLEEVNRRWDDLLKGIVERQRELENALLRLGQFQHALTELMAWIDKTNKSLDGLKVVYGDPQVIEVELAKLKVVVNDIQAHQNSVDTLNDAGRQIIESERGSENASRTQQKLNELNRKWSDLEKKAHDKQKELEDALRDAQAFNAEIQDLLFWLNDVDGALSTTKPVGGLPETAKEQLDRFMEIFNELETNRPKVEAVLHQGNEYLKKSAEGTATNLQHNLRTLRQRWESVMNRANDKKIKLEIALKEATEFHKAVQDFIDWLTDAERYLTGLQPVSRVLDRVVEQVESHKEFQKEISSHREDMLNLEKKGNHLKYFSQKQDVILIKNLLVSVQHRWDRVVSKSTERTRALDLGLKEAKEFQDSWSSLCRWLDDAEKNLDEMITTAGQNPAKIKQMLAKHKEFQRTLAAKQPSYDSTMRNGKALKDKAPKPDEPILRQMLTDLKSKWDSVCRKSIERQRNLEEALLRSGQFKDALQELLDWLNQMDKLLVDDSPVHGDLDTVMALIEQHKKVEDQLQNRRNQMNDIVRTGEEMMETAPPEERSKLASQIRDVKSQFEKVKNKCENRSRRLEGALKEAEKLHKSVHMLLEWLSDAETKLRYQGSLPDDEAGTKKLLDEQDAFMRELALKERDKDATLDLAKSILAKAHPDAVNVIKHWISIIQSRWDEISSWARQRQQKLQAHLASLRDSLQLLEELIAWLQKCEDTLTRQEAESLPDDLIEIRRLIQEHNEFMYSMEKRQTEIDAVCKPKSVTRSSIGGVGAKGKPGARLRSVGDDSREESPEMDFGRRRLSPGRERTPDLFQHIGPRFDRRGSKSLEPQIKNPRVKFLWDKWKHVWMMAWERQRRLQDKYNYLMELDKVKNFSWDDWRKRFLKYNNHKKSRVTDIFRKIDKNNDHLIPREDFIDAIIRTKFPTSRLEMNAVADMFDHGDHLIDYMEFIAALRPDWEEKRPVAEPDIIDDEIQRQVMKCTCKQKFRVFQVGEGKYRFGDSQKLRLVRILRSTVMVRVGGGWVSLDEFLVKNDPCRAKGRTNIELREQFILADGVSQTMTAFRSKPSASSVSSGNRSAQSLPAAGPITKVKERSIRSVPMGRARSIDRHTPDSAYSEDYTSSRMPRKSSAGPRTSQPGSRTGSKPPSRIGSNTSLDDDGTPVRRSSSLKRGTAGTFLSSRPGATSTPTSSRAPFSLSTNIGGSSSRGRSPAGERAHSFTRAPVSSPMKRTGSSSSVSSLPASGQRPSRIPVFVGGETGDGPSTPSTPTRLRTPSTSQSNIPIAISSTTPTSRTRTPSGSNVSFNLPTTTSGIGESSYTPSRLSRNPSGDT